MLVETVPLQNFLILIPGGADGVIKTLTPVEMMSFDMNNKVILSVTLPKFTQNDFLKTYKIMPRALVSAGNASKACLNMKRASCFFYHVIVVWSKNLE